MELQGKKTLVLGAGKSGVGSAKFLAARGAVVALHDKKPLAEWTAEAQSLKEQGIGLMDGMLPSWLLDQIELVVISPGVPTSTVPARYVDRAAQHSGGEVIGEVELAYRFMKGRIVGITGSNGKTTTTTLIGQMLKDAGLKCQVGGNIGTALISLAETSTGDTWTVVELSSFQLETIVDFRPNVAVALNVTPNHMDRYDLFTDYAAAKHRLFMNQISEDVAILNADDEITASWAAGLKARVSLFSTGRELDEGLFMRGRDLICKAQGSEKILTTRDEMNLRGIHNVQNVLAGFAAGLACGADPDSMRETVRNFKPVEHRLELVTEVEGVKFYNDSKATSVDATLKALEALAGDEEGQIVLILGGRGKNAPYEPLAELVRSRVRALVLIGEDADNIESQLNAHAEIIHAGDMKDAVERSFAAAEKGAAKGGEKNDVVLLAPACASFDMFKSFEQRGEIFKREVRALGAKADAAT